MLLQGRCGLQRLAAGKGKEHILTAAAMMAQRPLEGGAGGDGGVDVGRELGGVEGV